ncbi:MAG: hypothetical protein J7L04_13030 [Bacteroidales bacterium]|nr:hypothetical protein [Bacteroidales bacterium]
MIPSENSERTTLQAPSANDVSIVLWLSCQNATVLLGSDLEETGDAQTGWQAILNSPVKPTGKANIFKIPHHGSITGHSDDVWESMVEKDALCLMTENTRGNYSIPKSEDVDRIRKYSSNLFCTSLPKQKLKKRDNAVERTLRGMVANRKSLGGKLGHIQVRITAKGEIRVNSQGPACKL